VLLRSDMGCSLGGMRNAILFHQRPSVHGEEPYLKQGDPVTQNTADLKE
jgi:hypothetical protein